MASVSASADTVHVLTLASNTTTFKTATIDATSGEHSGLCIATRSKYRRAIGVSVKNSLAEQVKPPLRKLFLFADAVKSRASDGADLGRVSLATYCPSSAKVL